jgi:hypothetical protein
MITRVGVSVAGRGNMLPGWLGYPIARFDRAIARQRQSQGVEL